MPLIVRPAAGQIVDPAWGTLVADAVVMRFATAAQRASQLPAPVTGQLTQLDSRLGTLQYWSGAAWVDAGLFIQSAFAQPTTNASGDAAVVYPTPFVATPTVTFSSLVTGTATPITLSLVAEPSGAAGFTFRAYRAAAVVASTPVGIYYTAVGARPAPA